MTAWRSRATVLLGAVVAVLAAVFLWDWAAGRERASSRETTRTEADGQPELVGLREPDKDAERFPDEPPKKTLTVREQREQSDDWKIWWHVDFEIEGAATWRRAWFMTEDRALGDTKIGNFGENTLEVRGSGRLIVFAADRPPWISGVLERPPSNRLTVTATFERGRALSGAVVAADGVTPVSTGEVHVVQRLRIEGTRDDVTISRSASLDAHGRFRIDGLTAGEFDVTTRGTGTRFGEPVSAHARAGDDVELRFKPWGFVRLHLFDKATKATGIAHVGAVYTYQDGETRESAAATRGSESLVLELRNVVLGRRGTATVTASGYRPHTVEFELPQLGGTLDMDVPLELDERGPAILRVTLRYAQGEPPDRISVRWRFPRHRRGTRAPIVDGVLELRVPPGATSVVIGGTDRRSEMSATVIRLRPGDSEPGARLEVEREVVPAGTIEFTPHPAAQWVTLTQRTRSEVRALRWQRGFADVRAVPPGQWTYRIETSRETWVGTVDVRAGKTTSVTLD